MEDMSEDRSARAWLDSRSDDQLQELLAIRPDLHQGAPVVDLDDLARRLEHPMSVSSVVMNLPRPAVELLEAVTALDVGATSERLLELLDTGGRDRDEQSQLLLHWIEILEVVGLAWEVAGRHVVNPGVHRIVVNPLLMGSPARLLTQDLTVDVLKQLYAGLGVPAPPRKAELLAGIGALYADGSRIRQTLAKAPEEVMETLAAHAADVAAASKRGDEALDEDHYAWTPSRQGQYQRDITMRRWASQHGLAVTDSYYSYAYAPAQFPAEVLLALVPPSYRAPFHPRPPQIPTTEVSPVQTERASAAAVTEAVAAMTAVLESTLRTPVQRLKSGGVGAREIKRLSKAVGVGVAEVRLALELGARCGFFDWTDELRPSGEFEQWRRQSAAERAGDLLRAWWPLRFPPTRERDEDGMALPALTGSDNAYAPTAPQLAVVLQTLDGAATSLEPVLELLGWNRPMDQLSADDARHTWDEAALLGVIRDGRLTDLGRTLLTGEQDQVVEQLRTLLPAESQDVLFGSDLTIVVPGSTGAAVVDLLDALAVRESHGVGATWRVSEASVRDALDHGYTVDALLSELREVAGKALPQPLEYLLRDVDRRHGVIGVRPASCVVVSQDEGLLAEVAATKVLRPLGLTAVAPTVLVGTADRATTLAALRKAGYLPVEQDSDGSRTVELRSRGPVGERAAAPDDVDALSDEEFNVLMERELAAQRQRLKGRAPSVPRLPEEPAELVSRLRSGGRPSHEVDQSVLSLVEQLAPRLRPDEQRHLVSAVASDGSVVIRYRNESGNESERKVSDLDLSGAYLTGYCHLRQDVRFFRLDRITMVAPVT